MCDANDNAVHVVFGQTEEGRPYAVYHASKMLNDDIKNTQLLRSYLQLCLHLINSKLTCWGFLEWFSLITQL